MTLFVLGDYHGQSIEDFLRGEEISDGDKFVSLGDIETTEVIRELIELEQRLGEENFHAVGGNHDRALIEDERLTSRHFKPHPELVDQINSDEEAKDWLESSLSHSYSETEYEGNSLVAVHGGLAGKLPHPEMDSDIRHLWYRLWEEENYEKNFRIMEQKGWDVLLRGHDHDPELVEKNVSGEITYEYPEGGKYSLKEDSRYIITPGAWMDGLYAKIEDSEAKFMYPDSS